MSHDTSPLERIRNSLILPALVVIGLTVGVLAELVLQHPVAPWAYGLVYLVGGLPAGWQALRSLWRDHVLDIDLLMVLAALAAAAVGAPMEGAILLTLFAISQTLEHRAMGRARRAVRPGPPAPGPRP